MSIALCYLGIAVTQYGLHLVERSAAVHQEGCILMAQIVDPQVPQPGFGTQPIPYLHDRRIWQQGLPVDEQVLKLAFGVQLSEDIKSGIIQRYRTYTLGLRIARRYAPHTILSIDLTPCSGQSLIQTATG